MSKSTLSLALGLVLSLAANALAQEGPSPLLTRSEPELLAVLQSEASHKTKADACRELAVIGTAASIPVLVRLLPDQKLSHMARYALETLDDDSVDAALRQALTDTEGRPRLGVISSLGARQDAKAVGPLADLLGHNDSMVIQAAARALGRIGNARAAQALLRALPETSSSSQLALEEGLFR